MTINIDLQKFREGRLRIVRDQLEHIRMTIKELEKRNVARSSKVDAQELKFALMQKEKHLLSLIENPKVITIEEAKLMREIKEYSKGI